MGGMSKYFRNLTTKGILKMGNQESITTVKACNYPIFLSQCFHRPIHSQFEFNTTSDPVGTSVTNHKPGHIFKLTSSSHWKIKKTAIFPLTYVHLQVYVDWN